MLPTYEMAGETENSFLQGNLEGADQELEDEIVSHSVNLNRSILWVF